MGTKRVGLARVEALIENLKRELALDGASLKGVKSPVESVTASTKTVTTAESGTIFTLNRAAGITVTLPAAEAGLRYEFHVGTTFTGTMGINAASDADTYQGLVSVGPVAGLATNAGNTTGILGPALNDHLLTADADTKGRLLGGHIVFTCITDSIWTVSGHLVSAGAVVSPFTT